MKNKKKSTQETKRFKKHTLFGNVPIIQMLHPITGKTYWDFDPNYSPPMPVGAVRGDIRKQNYCSFCNVPQYFYIDKEKKCIQCGDQFTFTAKEQKYWYETLHFINHSTAIRCLRCRKANRTKRSLNNELSEAVVQIRQYPNDPDRLLNFVQSILRYYESIHEGDLNKALFTCRQILKIVPKYLECIFYEAECHYFMKNYTKAKVNYEKFYNNTYDLPKWRKLRNKSKDRISAMVVNT